MDHVFKSFDAEIMDVMPGSREIVAKASSDALDRENEVVLPGGLMKKNYQGLPVLFNHNPDSPIGVHNWAKAVGNGVVIKWRASDKTQTAREAFDLAKDGVLTRYSIGFIAHERGSPTAAEVKARPEYKDARGVYRRWELVETSLVSVPANPDAVQLAIAKGYSPESLAAMGIVAKAAGVSLNGECESYVRKLIAEGKINRSAAWSFDGADGNELLGPGENWGAYGRAHLGVDKSAKPDTKAYWKYPVVKGGKVYIHALRAAESRAGQEGATEIEAAAKALLAAAEGKKSIEQIAVELAGRLHKRLSDR